jgi:hypothetical protein
MAACAAHSWASGRRRSSTAPDGRTETSAATFRPLETALVCHDAQLRESLEGTQDRERLAPLLLRLKRHPQPLGVHGGSGDEAVMHREAANELAGVGRWL